MLTDTIKEELAGPRDLERLERLYAAKIALTCAIEEIQNRLSIHHNAGAIGARG
jgi:hypothetical protein